MGDHKAHRKREALLLTLDRLGMHSLDIKTRIFREVFPSLETINSWLDQHGIHRRDAPEVWAQPHMEDLLAQEGCVREETCGVVQQDMEWLHRACFALGLKCEDRGSGSTEYRRKFCIEIPQGWIFDPTRPVGMVYFCCLCRFAMQTGAFTDSMGRKWCTRCKWVSGEKEVERGTETDGPLGWRIHAHRRQRCAYNSGLSDSDTDDSESDSESTGEDEYSSEDL